MSLPGRPSGELRRAQRDGFDTHPHSRQRGEAPFAQRDTPGARRDALRLWGWPVALGVLTTSGLLSALVSDTWGDAWSWLALGLPVAVMAWFAWRPAAASKSSSPPQD
jgi:hypothetical protein